MRNSKVKGFTLIELIVVIAIIGVLAAILVPSMLGYVRNARISSANANAKQVHTALASALTQLGIDNYPFTAKKEVATVTIKLKSSTEISCDFTDVSKKPDNARMDLISYLGETFTGVGKGWFKPATYSVTAATWNSGEKVSDEAEKAVNATTGAVEKTSTQQKDDAKKGAIYGVYPTKADS